MDPRNEGVFVPTTNTFEVTSIVDKNITAEYFREFIVRLQNRLNEIAISLNQKETGAYLNDIVIIGSFVYPDTNLSSSTPQQPSERPLYRKTVIFGALPNNTTKTVAHGIPLNSNLKVFKIIAVANDLINGNRVPLSFYSPASGLGVAIELDNTNVIVTSNFDATRFTDTDVIIEYY